jgi:hypothetical protein
MKTLMIKDLSATEELGSKAMSAVRGGALAMYYYPWGGYSDSSEKNFSFEALQQINQGQSVQTSVGNNVASLGGFASPSVPVTASQHADITNNVVF